MQVVDDKEEAPEGAAHIFQLAEDNLFVKIIKILSTTELTLLYICSKMTPYSDTMKLWSES